MCVIIFASKAERRAHLTCRVKTADLLFWENPFGLEARALPRFPKTQRMSSEVITEWVGRILEIMTGLHHHPHPPLAAKPAALGL